VCGGEIQPSSPDRRQSSAYAGPAASPAGHTRHWLDTMKTLLLSTAALVLAPAAAQAQTSELFERDDSVHLGAGYTVLDSDAADVEYDAITLRGGYDYNRYFGGELDVLVGLGDESVNLAGVSASTELDYGVAGFGKASFPLNDRVSVFARAGYAYFEGDASVAGLGASGGEGGAALGAGAELNLSERDAVRFDYTRYDLDDAEFDGFGLTYVRAF